MAMVNWLTTALGRFGKDEFDLPHPRLAQKEQFVAPNRVFEMLDGRELRVSNHHWNVEVYSVSDQAQHRWVQIGLKGEHDYMLTLRLDSGSSGQRAIDTLSSWLRHPSDAQTDQILNVA